MLFCVLTVPCSVLCRTLCCEGININTLSKNKVEYCNILFGNVVLIQRHIFSIFIFYSPYCKINGLFGPLDGAKCSMLQHLSGTV